MSSNGFILLCHVRNALKIAIYLIIKHFEEAGIGEHFIWLKESLCDTVQCL